MNVANARNLANSLNAAADHAENHGKAEVDLMMTFKVADDAARAELQSAIEAADRAQS